MPLLALAEHWKIKEPGLVPVFVDVRKSVASTIIPKAGYTYYSIIAPKLRRYWTWWHILVPFQMIIGIVQAYKILRKHKPRAVIGAGGFVQVPVMFAAAMLRIPIFVHQQDLHVTLSNRICAPLARKITTAFEKSVKDFSQGTGFSDDYSKLRKVVWTGNPARSNLANAHREDALKYFKLDLKWPTLLVFGGGSGAEGINYLIADALKDLSDVVQIIHSVGAGKAMALEHERYRQYPFIERMDLAYAASDIVLSRSGLGTITELSQLRKTAILVPMPDSHQEANAEFMYQHRAALVLGQEQLNAEMLITAIRKLLFDATLQHEMRENLAQIMPKDAAARMLSVIQGEIK